MTRFRIGVAILLVLLVLAVGIQAALPAVERPVEEALNLALDAAKAGNLSAAVQAVDRADAAWQRVRPITAALADHSALEELDKSLAALPAWSTPETAPDFAAACSQALLCLQAIRDAHRLSLSNLL